jgi:transposase
LVPADHFYRHLARTLDLAFVRDLVAARYASRGRPSIDPVVFFKLQLILFFEGIRSERQLMRTIADRISLRWYLGYGFGEVLPHHSSLTRIRQRYGLAIFRRFFDAIVEQCQQAGLVWGRELYIDATKVEANASLASTRPRFFVEAHLAHLFPQTVDARPPTTVDVGRQAPPRPVPTHAVPVATPVLPSAATTKHDWYASGGHQNRAVRSTDYQRRADVQASLTDPDATVMQQRNRASHFGYHTHYVVDGGKARIILTALVTPAEVMENQPMQDLVWHTCFRWQIWPRHVTSDTTYGTVDNVVALEDAGMRAYMPLVPPG